MPRTPSTERPDLSTVTSDGPIFAEVIDLPTPEAARERDEQSRLGQHMAAELEARDRKIAADYNLDYDLFAELTPEQRIRAINRVRKQGSRPQVVEDAPTLTGDADDMVAQFSLRRQGLITRDESKDWTVMCDPVVTDPLWGRYTPGVSRIPVGAIDKKKEHGFTEYPIAPFKPDPTVGPCGMFLPDGTSCAFMAYYDRDDPTHSTQMEDHQQAIHPRMYKARQDRLDRERQEQQIELQRQQVELARQQLLRGA